MARKVSTGWRAWLLLVLSLVLLNASLTFENVWPTPKIAWGLALSLELAVCVLILSIAHRRAPMLARRVLPALWVVLVAGHYLDVTAPGLYGREFNLYWDSQHLGNVAAMLGARRAMVADCGRCRHGRVGDRHRLRAGALCARAGGRGDGPSAARASRSARWRPASFCVFAGQRIPDSLPDRCCVR